MNIKQMIKPLARDGVARLLSFIRLTSLAKIPSRRLIIITFHRVLPLELKKRYPLPGLAVTPDELRWVISNLSPYFDIRNISDAYSALKNSSNRKPLLSITFDDGQWDNLEYGLPVLEKEGVVATFYIPTENIGTKNLLWHDVAAYSWEYLRNREIDTSKDISFGEIPDHALKSAKHFTQYLKSLNHASRSMLISKLRIDSDKELKWTRLMNWAEINHLIKKGHEIGSHAKSHSLLSQLSFDEQHNELKESSDVIEKYTSIRPASFCYPDGNYSESTLKLLNNSSYKSAVTTKWGINKPNTNKFELLRCDIDANRLRNLKGELSKPRFQLRLSGYQPGL